MNAPATKPSHDLVLISPGQREGDRDRFTTICPVASITTRLVTAAMMQRRSDPARDVAEHLDALLDTVTVLAHGAENGQPVRSIAGPVADAAAQIHALARRRKAHYPAHPIAIHLAHYLDQLTAVAIDAADAADLDAATIADRIHRHPK